MTDQVNLPLVWADTGGVTDPGNLKYSTGWISEIPTYQNFNFVLQNQTKNLLALAEKGQFGWESTIVYTKGAQVIKNFTLYTCITGHTNQDPALDATHSYWTLGYAYGTNSANLVASHGLLIDEVNTVVLDKWDGNALTINNVNALIAFNTTGAFDNYVFGNVKGEFVVVNVGNTEPPDGRSIDPVLNNSWKIFHEGHPPIQSEVVGTIPTEPQDGTLYARRNGNWIEVSATKVQEFPPQPVVGNGNGWYNLQDGELYIDINDGDSSQWVPASNPKTFDIEPDINIARAGRKNLLINGCMRIWQRGITWSLTEGNQGYLIDRWFASVSGSVSGTLNVNKTIKAQGNINYDACRITSTLDNNTGYILAQGIEDIKKVRGKKFILSLLMSSDTTQDFQLGLQYRNSVNTSTDATFIDSGTISVPGDGLLHKFSVILDATVVTPHVNNTCSVFGIKKSVWSNFDAYITEVQLEEVDPLYPDATKFEYRNPAEELALCQRYYERVGNNQYPHTAGTTSTVSLLILNVQHKVTKRGVPTVSYSSSSNLTNLSFSPSIEGTVITATATSATNAAVVIGMAIASEL